MSYIDGFVVAVPRDRKAAYLALAEKAAPIFAEFGMRRMVEAWEAQVTDGQVTDFRRAVKATPDEAIVYSWIEYDSREARDAANAKMHADPRMEGMGEMPFDGKRMIFSGFAPLSPTPPAGPAGFVDGTLIPVREANRAAFEDMIGGLNECFLAHGALRSVDAWGDDLMKGEVTDFYRAVAAEAGETCVFSFVEWADQATHDAAWPAIMADPRMPKPGHGPMVFDGNRMVLGTFATILDTLHPAAQAAE